MSKDADKDVCKCNCSGRKVPGGTSSAVYGLGFIGAVVYFLQHATTFWIGVLGIIKAIVWPALVIYKVLELLKM